MSTLTLPPRPSHPQDGGRGLLLALGAHGLLVWALAYGVSWRSSETGAVAEAELWAAVPQAAAPRAEEPPPPPPAPSPAPAPAPKAAEPPKVDREAEIAEQRERRRQEQLRKEAEEAERKERKEREQREERRIKELEKLEAKRKQDAEQKAQERADREAKQEAERREKQRQDNLRRIQGLAGGSGAPESSGTAAQSAGPSAGYAGRIMARIKPNITFTETVTQRWTTVVEVRCAPDGLIVARRITKPSGNAAWDDAVLKAIDKTERIPRDTDGRVPPVFPIVFNSID